MANKWDKLMKMLVRANPQDFVSFLSQGMLYQGDVTNELIIRSVEADFLCMAQRNATDAILHAEYQRYRDENMGRRMWEYNAATAFITGLPVFSYAIYLWKQNNIVQPPYVLEVDGEIIHQFYYTNICLAEEEPETLLKPGLTGMLPLLPLTKGAKQTRNEIIDVMVEGLRTGGKDDILALGYTFAGLVYDTESDKKWLKRRFAMFHDILESSWSYQEIVQKGVDQGLQKGFEKGELKTLRSVLVRLVEKHSPELLPLAQQQAAQLNNLVALNAAVDKLISAKTVEQVRQILDESKITDS
jgi:hypothetical protein